MITITNTSSLHTQISNWKLSNQTIAFVPTMGNLHAGHLDLVKKAQTVADKTIVSIFVNPLQFGPNEDFERYPRTHDADIAKLIEQKTDLLFLPDIQTIYPNGHMPNTRVNASQLADDLCGKTRPGHFSGVTTIVAKLFNLTQPDIAIFGEKDFQQLTLIKQMVKDLNFPIEILAAPTTRESDGLAMSSRNQYLTAEERRIAPVLYQTLSSVKQQLDMGNKHYDALCEQASKQLLDAGFKVDYVAIRTQDSLELPQDSSDKWVVLAAAFLGKTRLIDNALSSPSRPLGLAKNTFTIPESFFDENEEII